MLKEIVPSELSGRHNTFIISNDRLNFHYLLQDEGVGTNLINNNESYGMKWETSHNVQKYLQI